MSDKVRLEREQDLAEEAAWRKANIARLRRIWKRAMAELPPEEPDVDPSDTWGASDSRNA